MKQLCLAIPIVQMREGGNCRLPAGQIPIILKKILITVAEYQYERTSPNALFLSTRRTGLQTVSYGFK